VTYQDDRVARIYDWIVYGTEDAGLAPDEWRFLQQAFRQHAQRPVKDVLDAGCGTGRHVLALADAGYRVSAFDNSTGMLERCRERLRAAGLRAELALADVLALDAREEYDAVLAMDSVVCYLDSSEDVRDALGRFYAALRPGGLLVLDNHNFLHMWDVADEPEVGYVAGDEIAITYTQRRWYDDFPSTFHVEVIAQVEEETETYELTTEEVLRAMTTDELRHYLAAAGFGQITMLPGYDLDAPPALNSERIIALARKGASGAESAPGGQGTNRLD
jgi:SAM-dependent methyltransferase